MDARRLRQMAVRLFLSRILDSLLDRMQHRL
jgi:hypothetical protein